MCMHVCAHPHLERMLMRARQWSEVGTRFSQRKQLIDGYYQQLGQSASVWELSAVVVQETHGMESLAVPWSEVISLLSAYR